MERTSTWKKTANKPPEFPELKEDIVTDVLVIGAGITGLTLAHQLKEKNRKVVIIDAQDIGKGTTAYSSNHLSTDIDFGYRNVKSNFSEEVMKMVADSRKAAIDQIEEICHSLKCDFSRTKGYLYAEREDKVGELEEEFEHAASAGLNVTYAEPKDLPFTIAKAVEFPDQAIFNTQKYLNQLAISLTSDNQCDIYCNTAATHVDNKNKMVETTGGNITAEHIVMATHIPQFINSLQTMVVPYRSYMISVKLPEGSYPEGLYWDMKEPYFYTRSYHQDGESWLLIGGADHETGNNGEDPYSRLRSYAKERYDPIEFVNEWSAQYYEPSDGLPYIGKSPLSNVYVATGYSGDGLVYGVVAAMIISSLIQGEEHPWLEAYDARRFKPVASAKDFVSHNLEVGKELIKGIFKSENLEDLAVGEGRIVSEKGKKYAVSRAEDGELKVVSAICSHMGCVVNWNQHERTWDCACHGSRFKDSGEVIEGPAVKGLERKDDR